LGQARRNHRILASPAHQIWSHDAPVTPPCLWEIRINGRLGATALSAFPSLVAELRGGETVLTGPLADRSAVFGVIAQIEALGLEMIGIRQARPRMLEPLEEHVDHVRGPAGAPVILEYGDYECPYSRKAFRAIGRVERQFAGGVRFAFRHFPLTDIHPHALAAAAAAEAASLQDRFWPMHELLFHRQQALEADDLRHYASELALDVARFEDDRSSRHALDRVGRDAASGTASGEVLGTPTLFIRGRLHRGGYDVPTLLRALAAETTADP
jgi:protein-disulfide isomerase